MNNWLFRFIKTFIIMSIVVIFMNIIYLFFDDISVFSTDSSEKYIVPGKHKIIFNKTGQYYLSAEYKTILNDSVVHIKEIPRMIISLKMEDSFVSKGVIAESEYSYNSIEYAGFSIMKYTIDSIGAYFLEIQYENGDSKPIFPVTFINTDRIINKFIINFVLFGLLSIASFFLVSYYYKRWNIKWGLKVIK